MKKTAESPAIKGDCCKMSRCKASTSERGGVLVGRRTSERGDNAADGRFATVPLCSQGMALVAMVMLIVFVSIAVLGVSTFIIEGLRHAEGRRQNVAAAFLAQAGIHQSLYYYRYRDQRGNGYFTKGQTNIDAQNFFKVDATAADTLMVRTNVATLSNVSGVPRDLTGLRIQNATNSNTNTIDRLVVTWDNASLLHRSTSPGNH